MQKKNSVEIQCKQTGDGIIICYELAFCAVV